MVKTLKKIYSQVRSYFCLVHWALTLLTSSVLLSLGTVMKGTALCFEIYDNSFKSQCVSGFAGTSCPHHRLKSITSSPTTVHSWRGRGEMLPHNCVCPLFVISPCHVNHFFRMWVTSVALNLLDKELQLRKKRKEKVGEDLLQRAAPLTAQCSQLNTH